MRNGDLMARGHLQVNMLNLTAADTEEGLGECDLLALAQDSRLTLVAGVTGSGHDIVANAMWQQASGMGSWPLNQKLMGSEFRTKPVTQPKAWWVGEVGNPGDTDLRALCSLLDQGHRVLGFIHADVSMPSDEEAYQNLLIRLQFSDEHTTPYEDVERLVLCVQQADLSFIRVWRHGKGGNVCVSHQMRRTERH